MFGFLPIYARRLSEAKRSSHAQRKMSSLIPGLLVVALILSQTACSPLFTVSASNGSIQEDVDNAVAATMVAFYVEATQSAAKQASSPVAPTAVPPTPTPAIPVESSPTAIPVLPISESSPTPLPAPAIVTLAPAATAVSSALPTIWADVNTNCRYGPSINFGIAGYLTVGITSLVHGSDTYKEWWYIENPQKKGYYCWVWSQSTHVDGNVSAVPVVAASAQPAPVVNSWCGYGYNYSYGCGYNYQSNYNSYNCGNYSNWNCYCPCKIKKLTCNQKKKWCTPIVTCQCKKVCYNPCNQNPCYNPYNQVNWNSCPSTNCSSSWSNNNPVVRGW